jgi:hypothetical protein
MRPMDGVSLGLRIPWKMGHLDEASLTNAHRGTCRDKSVWWERGIVYVGYFVNGIGTKLSPPPPPQKKENLHDM